MPTRPTENGEENGAAFVADETEFNVFNTDRKLAALGEAVRKLAALPEKKALIYFCSGVNQTGVENQALVGCLHQCRAAGQRGDLSDRRPRTGRRTARRRREQGSTRGSGHLQRRSAERAAPRPSTGSQETARDAGVGYRRQGPYLDSNELSMGIVKSAAGDSQLLRAGYYHTNSAADGKYRRITVKLNGKLSAKLEHRQGYWAEKSGGQFSGSHRIRNSSCRRKPFRLGIPRPELPLGAGRRSTTFRIAPRLLLCSGFAQGAGDR